MNLVPDYTVLYQLVIFVATLVTLRFILFQPLLRVMDKRRDATDGVKEEVARLKQEADRKLHEYEEKIGQARLQAIAHKEKIKKTGEEEALRITSKARADSDTRLREVHASLLKEQNEARLLLRKSVEKLGTEMAEKILEKKVG